MKNFSSPSFFRLFDLLLSTHNSGFKKLRWEVDGVEWEHDRYTATCAKHGLSIDIITLTRKGRRGWTLMVTKEFWWVGQESKPLKNLRWARVVGGRREDIMNWLRTQEIALDRLPLFPRSQTNRSTTHSGQAVLGDPSDTLDDDSTELTESPE